MDASGGSMFKESRGEGNTQADESAYQLIMRDKEKLLSFDSKLKFIFSHSALREGWDSPNVFQICTLNETTSVMKKRQEIGRGLRIAVNQEGERVFGFDVNRLTIMANESYDDFARKLQKEIEEETGIKFGVVEKHLFAGIPITTETGEPGHLGVDVSDRVWDHLKEKGYIDHRGKVQDSLRQAIKDEDIDLPEEVAEHQGRVNQLLRKVAGNLNIKNADNRQKVNLNKAVFLSPEFQQLWDRIKYRTTFRVDFDCEKLIEECSNEIKNTLVVGKARFKYEKALTTIDRGGVEAEQTHASTHVYEAKDFPLPDIVSYLQNATNLTRRSIVEILTRSERLEDFKNNPQKYIERVTAIIQNQMRLFIVAGIKYQKIGDEEYFAQELFQDNELYGYLSRNMLESKKSVFEYVVYDSDVERQFANEFELNEEIKLYAKLPSEFKIDTPLGPYNPDWAVLVENDGQERLYFVVETKGGLFADAQRPTEQAKIDCGREHFKAIGTDVEFCVEHKYDKFSERFSR